MKSRRITTTMFAGVLAATLCCGGAIFSSAIAQDDVQKMLDAKEKELQELRERLAEVETSQGSNGFINPEMLPPDAKPGECYARVFVPPTYRTEEVTVMRKEAGDRIQITPAKYEWAEEKVLVKEATERIEIVPATYGWVEEKVLVKGEQKVLEDVPAVYETVTEKVLVRAAHKTWKTGRGPVEKIDDATGEILCLIEVPDQYETVSKTILKTPATTRERVIPAQYKTVKRQVVKTPATTRKTEIPAKYDVVRVQKIVSEPQTKKIEIPAVYDKVTKRVKVTEGKMEWRPILCETNLGSDVVYEIQRALKTKGYNPGKVDGVIGHQTLEAVKNYQRSKGLAVGALTMETIRSLGIKV